MTQTLKESTWLPVKRRALGVTGGGSNAYTISSFAASTGWYNNYIDNTGSRQTRLRRYHDADHCSVEISRALDILAEDISSCNADDDFTFVLNYPDGSKVKKSVVRTAQAALELWAERTEMHKFIFDRVRETIKFGATFYLKQDDGSLLKLPTERFVGYVLSEQDEDRVTHYIYNQNGQRLDSCGRIQRHETSTNAQGYLYIPVDKLVVLKIGDSPFGASVIEPVYRTWRKMNLIEDSVIVYRVVRAPERRIYYIDTGNLQGPKREAAIERQRLRLMQKQASRNGDVTTEFDPHSSSEDIFIPTNSTGKGSRIETLPGGSNLGEISDLEWFSKKLAAGLRIPYSMIDTQGDQQQQFTDMRVGQMYQIEMRYLGYVKRFKRALAEILRDNFIEFTSIREITIPEEAEFRISDSMSFAIYKEMEINQTALNMFNSTLQINSLSKKFSLQKYLNFDVNEVQQNEESKLRELGLDDEVIKKMPQSDVEVLVYGNPSAEILKKYKLEGAGEQNGGW